MAVQRCIHPSADVLKAFGLGKLDENSSQVVMNHLDACEDCRKEVANLSGDDFLKRLRQAHERDGTPAPARSLAGVPMSMTPPVSQTPIPNLPPELVNHPNYEILRELGRGGMGIVYQAKHRLSGRLEVLKVMNKALLGQAESKERFLREIQSAARLDHNNVVKMHTALELGNLLVLVMEYVEGEDLARVIKDRGPLPVLHACYYVQQAAAGLQHAFEKGMVHRDIKPQNLILIREGKKRSVKVLDFGLAKATRGENFNTGLTSQGAMMGTPSYIAPEQSLDAATADIRADIYSLGCTLYHLLAGTPPFSGKSPFEIVQAHHMGESRPLNLVRPEVPEALAAVVRKMMAKDAAQRYQTPDEVVRALNPFVKGALNSLPPSTLPKKGERIAAPPVIRETMIEGSGSIDKELKPVGLQQSRKWLTVSLFVGLLLAGLLVLGGVFVFRVHTPEGILVVEVNEPNADVYVDGNKATVSWADGGHKAEIRVTPGRHEVELKKDGFTVRGDKVDIEEGKRRILTARLVRQVVPKSPAESASQHDGNAVDFTNYRFVTKADHHVHFGKDGPQILLVDEGESGRVYDLVSGKALSPPLKLEHESISPFFSPDGKRVGSINAKEVAPREYSCSSQMVHLWDVGTAKEITPPFKHFIDPNGRNATAFFLHAFFSADGKRVLTIASNTDEPARLWDADTGKEITPPLKHETVEYPSFSPDGKCVVTITTRAEKTVRLWDAATGKEIIKIAPPLSPESFLNSVSFSPDGKQLVTADQDKTVRLWDVATGKEICPPLTHETDVNSASFSPDGKCVVTICSNDHSARLWDVATSKEITPPLKHMGFVYNASFSPDSKRVATTSNDKTVRIWDANSGKEITPPLKHESGVIRAFFSPDGKLLVTMVRGSLLYKNKPQLWDATTGKELKTSPITPD